MLQALDSDNINQVEDTSPLTITQSKTKIVTLNEVILKYTLDMKQSVAFEIMICSFLIASLEAEGVNVDVQKVFSSTSNTKSSSFYRQSQQLKKELKRRGGESQLIMFLSGMGGTGKSEVIKAFTCFSEKVSACFGWEFNDNTVVISALTDSAATELDKGMTLHKAVGLNKKQITDEDHLKWKGTKILVIDEVSFMNVSNLLKVDKQMRILKQIRELYGPCHVVFCGDFHQLLPIGGKALFQEDTIQFGAINKAVFLNISWRFKDNPEFGNIMCRFRNGTIPKQDIAMLNTRYIGNDDVTLPEMSERRYACSTNEEINALSAAIFLKHLENTHTKSTNPSINCPNHTVIIKGTMRYKGKGGKPLSSYVQHRIYDECGDADVRNTDNRKFDPALKFYWGVPLMMNSNDCMKDNLANGTPVMACM